MVRHFGRPDPVPPSTSHPPPVFIDAVVADRRYRGASEVSLASGQGLIAFEFHGISIKTRPGGMVYRYRLFGHADEWKSTRERQVEYQDLEIGNYTFEVEAVDREILYSRSPARVQLSTNPPYERKARIATQGMAPILSPLPNPRLV